MRRAGATLIGVVVGALALAIPAVGQSIDEIADGLLSRHYFIAEGAPISINQMEALVTSDPDFRFVALTETPDVGTDGLAAELLDRVGTGTVVVLSPDEVGAVSSEYDDAAIGEALGVVAEAEDAYAVEFDQFVRALPGAVPSPTPPGGFPWLAVVAVGVVGLIGFTVWRGGRRQKELQSSRLEEARTEIRHQMDVIADQIVKLADDPRTERSPEALAHYRGASDTFAEAESRLAAATTLAALAGLSDDLDRARWELEATTALMEGRDPPPVPVDDKPEHCFFDPTHGAGVEEAEIQTATGTRKVMVCRRDAEMLRRGEAPVPREIPMGPQRVPAPQAPRSAGGSGLEWLDVFSVIVGGMGHGVGYNWPRQSRRSSGGFGIPFPRRTTASRPGRARVSRSGSGSQPRGRGRRTR